MNKPSKMLAAGALVAAVGATGSALAPGARAASTGASSSTVTTTHFKVAKPATAKAAADVIACKAQVQRPHNSHHVRGTINVVVTVKCTKPVSYIGVQAGLYKSNRLVKKSAVKKYYGKRTGQANAAVPCRPGNYRGGMSYKIIFPPGYTPSSVSKVLYGPTVRIAC